MYSRPTTEQILLGVARDLQEQVLPHVRDEPARVALGMIGQLLRGCAVRSAHEIAWAEEESEQIADAVEGMDDPDVVAARSALAAAPAASLHLDDVLDHYHRASVVLSAGLEAAYRSGDAARIEALRAVLEDRTAREQQVIGVLDLVGRG